MPLRLRKVVGILVLGVSFGAFSVGAVASSTTTAFTLAGPGLTEKGSALSAEIEVRSAGEPGLVPNGIRSVAFGSPSVQFNPNARDLLRCSVKIPRNGQGPECPRQSRIGTGYVRGLIGTPGQSDVEFGPLSKIEGSVELFNYGKRRSGRMKILAVVTSRKPFRGVAFSFIIKSKSTSGFTFRTPLLRDLPPVVRNSYPKEKTVALTSLSVVLSTRPGKKRASIVSRSTKQLSTYVEVVER